ncbi:hypothetical protein BTVI_102895 [Pitangus sulphuratus]|nr:hypothetical protein BTVI_102895 [Pitangus sulphuratus]
MLSTQQFPALPAEEERYRQVLSTSRVLGTDEDNMGDGCSQKLASAKFLRLLLLILIPCICALILLLVILLTFVGVLEKTCFYSNGTEVITVNGDFETYDDLLPNMAENSSKTDPTVDLGTQPSSWTTTLLSHIEQMNKNSNMFRESFQENSFGLPTQATVLSRQPTNDAALSEGSEDNPQLFATAEEVTLWSTDASFNNIERMTTPPVLSPTRPSASQKMYQKKSACINITNSQCQMLPYNYTTVTSGLSIVKSIEMEKFLKFFSYLSRLSCYQHIMLFGCNLALPECISDGDDSQGLLPCRTFCEAAKEGCEPVLALCGGEESFLCASGICIPGKLQCNGYNDCDDWSDEVHCNCSNDEFRCNTGKCLNYTFVCDGYDDCGDLSDEQNCDCNPVTHHQCGDGRCITADWVCDGDHDCIDKSDEINCSCHSQGLVECRNGQCIPSAFQCDGDNDCKDGSDEENCNESLQWPEDTDCTQFPDETSDNETCLTPDEDVEAFCEESELECANHECVPRELWCDGQVDCSDSSDEWDCVTLPKTMNSLMFLTIHRSATDNHVCADDWQENLSQLACNQMGLGGPSKTEFVIENEELQHQKWLNLHSNWKNKNASTLHALLVNGRENAAVWKVVFGISNLDHPSGFMQTRLVKTIILHPRYNRAVVDYDISIVELDKDINETSYVRPVCLPSKDQLVQPDTYCYITGWGHMGNKMPFKLQEGEVRIISLEQCQSYFDMKIITSRMLCAGYESGTVDSCMGDSGGPLVCEQPAGHWTLFGLTSWGSVCFSKVLGPGVYSNVSHFIEWIERQIYIHTFLLN